MPTSLHTGIIIQARTGSTRLPGKMTLPFFGNQNLILLMINRFREETNQIPIVVATTTSEKDNVISEICARAEVPCFRGPEEDVLNRFIGAAKKFGFQNIVRVCADNPFFDLTSTLTLLTIQEQTEADYAGFEMQGGLPSIRTHIGLWGEVVTLKALERAAAMTAEPFYHEHVTNFIYGHPETFKINLVPAPYRLGERTDLRFTLDTFEDFKLHQNILAQLTEKQENNDLIDLIRLVDENPDFRMIMQNQITLNSK